MRRDGALSVLNAVFMGETLPAETVPGIVGCLRAESIQWWKKFRKVFGNLVLVRRIYLPELLPVKSQSPSG